MNLIDEFTVGEYELIVVIDGCTDNSEEAVIMNTLESTDIDYTIVHTPDVFETKANNAGIKKATGEYVIIIQDDMIIKRVVGIVGCRNHSTSSTMCLLSLLEQHTTTEQIQTLYTWV